MTFNPVINYLQALAFERTRASITSLAAHSPDLERFLLERGRVWEWRDNPLPPDVLYRSSNRCYGNAQALALTDNGYFYAEGWAACDGLQPCAHAWCLDTRSLAVVDPTWRRERKQRHYFGVVFWTSFIRFFQSCQNLPNQAVLDWSAEGWPIQTGKIPSRIWQFDFRQP